MDELTATDRAMIAIWLKRGALYYYGVKSYDPDTEEEIEEMINKLIEGIETEAAVRYLLKDV